METLLHHIKHQPETINFQTVIDTINQHYDFSPTAFTNGLGKETLHNARGKNEGSCRVFAFAQRHALSEAEVLACFGEHYRLAVLPHPDGDDHQNIRNFMKYGWQGIQFETNPLTDKGVNA